MTSGIYTLSVTLNGSRRIFKVCGIYKSNFLKTKPVYSKILTLFHSFSDHSFGFQFNEPTAVVGYKSLFLESLEYKSRHAVDGLNMTLDFGDMAVSRYTLSRLRRLAYYGEYFANANQTSDVDVFYLLMNLEVSTEGYLNEMTVTTTAPGLIEINVDIPFWLLLSKKRHY